MNEPTPSQASFEYLEKRREARSSIDAFLAFKAPARAIAQTTYDHEEWARFYLELLTDVEYIRFRNHPFGEGLWSDAELLAKARQHMEAAKILKALDDLHE